MVDERNYGVSEGIMRCYMFPIANEILLRGQLSTQLIRSC